MGTQGPNSEASKMAKRVGEQSKDDRLCLGVGAIEKLLAIVQAGQLPDVYGDGNPEKAVHDWLYDFYPDLSWDPEGSVEDIEYILKHSDFPKVVAFFERKYDFDFREELQKGLEDAKEACE